MARTRSGIAYDRAPRPGADAVILIHGLGLNRAVWQWQWPALAERFDTVRYDLYGHGESPAPPEVPSLSLFSRQLAELMEELDLARAAVVGFSLGGMIARRFAQDHRDRVAALAILHSPHRRTPEAQAAILARVAEAKRAGPGATVQAALERWFTPGFRAANPECMAMVRGWVLANDPQIYPQNYQVLADGVDEIVAPEPRIAAPTLAITGDQDFGNGPEMARAIAGEIDGAETLILPGLRHMALAEAPEAINAPLVAFLSRHLEDHS